MSDADIRRLRKDLDAMEAAAGLRLPFAWPDVWLALALAPCGIALSVWATIAPPGRAAWGLAPLLAVGAAGVARGLALRRRGGGERREHTFSAGAALLMAAALAVLILWEKRFGLPTIAVRGAALFLLGVMCVPLALSSRARRSALAVTLSLSPYGLLLPLCSPEQRTVVGGLAVTVAGLAAAAIMAWQLRADRRGHERAD
jgi:hypothetical protein